MPMRGSASISSRPAELDLSLACAQERRLKTFLVVDRAIHELGAKGGLINRDRRIEIGDGDADMVEAG